VVTKHTNIVKPEIIEDLPKDLYGAYMSYRKTLFGRDFNKIKLHSDNFFRLLGNDRNVVKNYNYFVDDEIIGRLVDIIRIDKDSEKVNIHIIHTYIFF
jgi:hypothetical protein